MQLARECLDWNIRPGGEVCSGHIDLSYIDLSFSYH